MNEPGRAALPACMTRCARALMLMLAASFVYTVAMTHLLKLYMWYGLAFFANGMEWPDFRVYQLQSLQFRTPAYWNDYGYPFTYPAPAGVLYGVLYMLPHPMKTYLVMLALAVAAWVVWVVRGLNLRGVPMLRAAGFAVIVVAASWPVTYLLDTANIEGVLAVVLALGVLAVLRGWFWTGAALIGLAASLKLYPFILLALLLSKRRYKEFAFGLLFAALLTWGSLALLGPSVSVAQAHINVGLTVVKDVFILPPTAVAFNFSHALFSPVKFAVVLVARLVHPALGAARPAYERALVNRALQIYLVVMAALGITFYFTQIRRLPMLNQVLALTVCAVTLTPYSSDYTLVHLLVPFGLLCFFAVDAERAQRKVAGLRACFVCLCLIFGWETFFMIKYQFASMVRTAALLVLLVAVMRFPFEWPLLDDVREVHA